MKKEHLKNIQIVCRNKSDLKKCIEILKQIGLKQVNNIDIDDDNLIITIVENYNINTANILLKDFTIYFFNKTLIKMLNNIIKEEKKLEDFEIAEDGRITKVNNWNSGKKVFLIYSYDNIIDGFIQSFLETYIKLGIVYATEEARDRAKFKMEIENQLKNIAERLNNGEKIDWNNHNQNKYYTYYDYDNDYIDYGYDLTDNYQGEIYCLSVKFLNEAKKEIGEENLIKYFKGE